MADLLAPCPKCGAEWEEVDLGLEGETEGGLQMRHEPGCPVPAQQVADALAFYGEPT